jgi:hypothetical protein
MMKWRESKTGTHHKAIGRQEKPLRAKKKKPCAGAQGFYESNEA